MQHQSGGFEKHSALKKPMMVVMWSRVIAKRLVMQLATKLSLALCVLHLVLLPLLRLPSKLFFWH